MFVCQATGKVSKPKEKPFRIIVETRPMVYESHYKDEEDRWQTLRTEGFEIVKELLVCKEFYEAIKLTENPEATRQLLGKAFK
jgi:hypothetical protein